MASQQNFEGFEVGHPLQGRLRQEYSRDRPTTQAHRQLHRVWFPNQEDRLRTHQKEGIPEGGREDSANERQ